jgi:hypothetical protein
MERRAIRSERGLPLGKRVPVPVVELLAFVDDAGAMSWAERWEAWNELYDERPFPTVTAMASAWRYCRGREAA